MDSANTSHQYKLRTLGKLKKIKKSRQSIQKQLRRINKIRERNESELAVKRINADVLTIEGVANYLHCSVQTVRSISENELPRTLKPGRRLLFLKGDVVEYVRRNRTKSDLVDKNSLEVGQLINSEADNVRGRS